MAVNALTLLLLMALSVNIQSVKGNFPEGLEEEVVSIYNNNFATPYSREPYFIKVLRCTARNFADRCWTGQYDIYPVPKEKMSIEIVVPDINNAAKFYKYIVDNHTSCTCGTFTALRNSLQQAKSVEINKTYYEKHFKKNPANLRGCKSFCKTPQPRHIFTAEEWFNPAFASTKKCLPGCNATTTITKISLRGSAGKTEDRHFPTDTECRDYNPNTNPSGATSQLVSPENTSKSNLAEYPLAIYIGSTRIFLTALFLSLILLTILIVDFTFCRRKRGFFYNLFSCKTRNNECLKCCYKETVV